MQQPDKQREAFEVWLKREYPCRTDDGYFQQYENGKYVMWNMQLAFEAWQAAQQSLQVNHIVETTEMGRQVEHNLKDVRCECCGYMTYHREHMGCIRAASHQAQWQPIETAPRDGTEILVGWNECSERLIVWWHNGWDTGNRRKYYEITPDVWMPLPQGPNVVVD